jgi:hypothetical protein
MASHPTPGVVLLATCLLLSSSIALPALGAVRSEREKMSPQLEQIRKDLIADRKVSFVKLRSLADAGDSLGTIAFAKRLVALGKPAVLSDALHYYTEAALGGRDYVAGPMLDILDRPNLSFKPSHLKQAERALNALAARGNTAAANGLMRLYTGGKPFGAKPEALSRLLERRIQNGDGDAAYRLAVNILSTEQKTPDTTAKAFRYLGIAARSGTFGIRASASNMIVLLKAENPILNVEASQ